MLYRELIEKVDDEDRLHFLMLMEARGVQLKDEVDQEFLDVLRDEGYEKLE